jgi:ABC-type branched-subunit amino acid transport system ATPase component
MIILELTSVSKAFGGNRAVNGVSFQIQKGKITSLIGPNGAGKSTMVNLITGFLANDSGKIAIAGSEKQMKRWHMPKRGITRTFQHVRLFDQMTVLDNIVIAKTERHPVRALFEKTSSIQIESAEAALKRVGLSKKKNTLVGSLSYGQKKLLEIARVIALNADIYVFDEPFAGLFKEMRKQVVDIIKDLRSQGKTIIFIEHSMDLIRELSDHVVMVDAGAFFAEGTPDEVLSRKDVMEAYLGV